MKRSYTTMELTTEKTDEGEGAASGAQPYPVDPRRRDYIPDAAPVSSNELKPPTEMTAQALKDELKLNRWTTSGIKVSLVERVVLLRSLSINFTEDEPDDASVAPVTGSVGDSSAPTDDAPSASRSSE